MNWNKDYHPERETSWSDIAESIRYRVRIRDILLFYCPDLPIRKNRCPCPLHDGKGFNFSFSDTGYKCFVCGEGGDAISLVQALLRYPSRSEAMKRINDDMHLGLPIGRAATFEQSMEMILRREKAQREKEVRERWETEYALLMDEWTRLDKILQRADPTSQEYANAAKKISAVGYNLDYHLAQEPR